MRLIRSNLSSFELKLDLTAPRRAHGQGRPCVARTGRGAPALRARAGAPLRYAYVWCTPSHGGAHVSAVVSAPRPTGVHYTTI